MNNDIAIRMVTDADAKELLQIYSPYVMNTAITFEYETPSAEEFSERIRKISQRYPYIAAVINQDIVGYAYASPFKNRAAYDWSVETSIYVKQECRGEGIGKKLYYELENLLKLQNIINVNACIAYTDEPDLHLDNSSVFFHENLGYRKVGHFTKCGYKFKTWYDMIWMEKMLGEHPDSPKPVIPVQLILKEK